MENKRTTELIDDLKNLIEDDFTVGGKYEQLMSELKNRSPFAEILNDGYDDTLVEAWQVIRELQAEVKKLKRHKHDDRTGDVLIRI